MSNLKDLIARQRAEVEAPKSLPVNVALGGELVEVEISRLLPDDWDALVLAHPPRATSRSDAKIGYDQRALPRNYPASHIRVAGEPVDQETWVEVYASLRSVNKNNVGTLMWGLNIFDELKELQALGKAAAGRQSSSPANRESRRAASKAGNRAK